MRWILLVIVLIALPVSAETISGYVVGITDGDTLTLLVDRTQIKVRLTEIDTPERNQDQRRRRWTMEHCRTCSSLELA